MNQQTRISRPRALLLHDIIEMLLQYLLIDDQEDSRGYGQRRKSLRKLMSNYALIAKPWRLPAQRILFAEIDISTHHRLEMMEYIMPESTANGRFLRGCVRSLRLRILRQDERTNLRPGDIPAVMRMFPSLYELRLDTKDLLSFSPETMRDLQKTPSIQALMLTRSDLKRVSEWSIWRKKTIDFDSQLLCKVPHWKLRCFVLGRGLNVQPRTSTPPPHRFEEFRFHGFIKGSGGQASAPEGLGWYLQNSQKTLQVLSTTCPGYQPSMLRLETKDRIQSAEFPLIDPQIFPFETFRGLKELMWLCVERPWSPQELLSIEALPQSNIMHIGFVFAPQYGWNLYFGRDTMSPVDDGYPLTPPPSLPVNLRRLSFIGYEGDAYTLRVLQERIQNQVGNDIEVRVYCSLGEYKERVPLKLIPQGL
ncbi:hypothetical protein CPB86DRAFT_878018 [Serendipita vermifera]|nr:hypothetical protein CPB86DRAFT_878018 [Serendipita vermifera]